MAIACDELCVIANTRGMPRVYPVDGVPEAPALPSSGIPVPDRATRCHSRSRGTATANTARRRVLMRWSAGDRGNIEDMRGRWVGGGGMIPLGIGGFIVVALLSMFTGVNFFDMLGGGSSSPRSSTVGTSGATTGSPTEERLVDMVDAVARDAQEVWAQKLGSRYEPTKVVLFRDSIQSTCGYAGAAT